MLYVILALLGFFSYYVFAFYNNVKKYPKGPRPLPVIGNLHQIDWRHIHLDLMEMGKTYGNIYTVFLPRPHVVLCDYENMKVAFSKNDDFAGRSGVFPDNIFQNVPNGGVVFSEGENWQEQRRTSIHILRDFGMGKNLMEGMVLRSVESCLEDIRSRNPGSSQGLDMMWPLQLFVGNVINETLFNFGYKPDNCEPMKDFVFLVQRNLDVLRESNSILFAQNYPWIENIPLLGHYAIGKYKKMPMQMQEMIKDFCHKARKGYDPSQEPECFVQAYIQKMEKNSALTEDQLLNVCLDFFVAGMETTTTTLRWAMLYMAKYSKVQEKLREELTREVGFSRLANMKDKPRMPYFTATIAELQRICNIAPVAASHRATKNSAIAGHNVPENTLVIPLLSNVLMNDPLFPSREKFNPDQFLLKDGKTLNKEALEHCIPFSIGKRVCAGEGLARVELFIGLAAILQNFKVEPLPGKKVDLTPVFTTVLLPTTQNVRLIPLKH